MNRVIPSFFRMLFVLFLYTIVAAVVLDLFMTKWGSSYDDPGYGIGQMLDYTAARPFAYRVLMPVIIDGMAILTPTPMAKLVDTAIAMPKPSKESYWRTPLTRLSYKLHRMQERYRWKTSFFLQRVYSYFVLFLCLLMLQFVLRLLGKEVYDLRPACRDFAPAAFVLFLPLLAFNQGGFLYDFPDLLLITLATLFLIRKRWLFYYPAFILAVLNKETSVLLVFALWAVHLGCLSRKSLVVHSLIHAAAGAVVVLTVRWWMAGNPGSGMEWHLKENLNYYASWKTYVHCCDFYAPGIYIPTFFNIIILFMVGFLIFFHWREKAAAIRRLFVVMFLVLLPLFVTGGFLNEVRAFYLTAPAFYLLGLHTFYCIYNKGIMESRLSQRFSEAPSAQDPAA